LIELTLFGSIDLRLADGTEARGVLQRPRAVALLAYLGAATLRPGAFHRRDLVLDLLWRDSGPDQSRTSLRQIIHFIRSGIGDDAIEGRGDDEIRLAPHIVRCDVTDFEMAVADGRYAQADELYLGELLPGFNLPDAPAFEQWLIGRRATLTETAADVAWKLATQSESEQNLTDASRFARRAVRLAIFDERKFRRAVELMVRAGNGAMAIMLYEEMRERLEQHGARPSPETRQLIDDIRRR
jgi:DNA-binding SARP family transcriptional activator